MDRIAAIFPMGLVAGRARSRRQFCGLKRWNIVAPDFVQRIAGMMAQIVGLAGCLEMAIATISTACGSLAT
jgi:hypothetical protein